MEHIDSIGEVFFWIPVTVLLLTILGLLWAPVAALTCLLVARLRKLHGESFGAAGAKHSILLVLPWIYLLVKLILGRPLPTFLVVPVYVLIYGIWLFFYIVVFNIGGLVGSVLDVFVTHSQPFSRIALFFIALSVILPLNVYMWRSSVRNLRRRYAADKKHPFQSSLIVPHRDYTVPFAWLIAWSFVVLVITVVAGLSAYAGT